MDLGEAFPIIRDVFAVIGACGTMAALVWRVYTWRHGRQTRVKVKVSAAFPTFGPLAFETCVLITAINDSDHAVRITSAGVVLPGERTAVVVAQAFPGALPTEIRPHDSADALMELEPLKAQGLDQYEVVAFVRTSADERFESAPTPLFSRK